MKKCLFIFLPCFLLASGVVGQGSYEKEMLRNLNAFSDSAKSYMAIINLGKDFERIVESHGDQWLPSYYAASCYLVAIFNAETDVAKIDTILDKAEACLRRADSLETSNSEITCLLAQLAQGRILVDPILRGSEYGQLTYQLFEKAMKEDANNPRAYYLKGQMVVYTPETYGGGCVSAKPLLETAVKKFENFVPKSPIHPNWGRQEAIQLLDLCR